MKTERWQRLEELFYAAVDLAPEERDLLLDRECASDPGLRRQVESLIISSKQGDTFIHAAVQSAARNATETGTAADGLRQIGPYQIERELGHGGMGAVFLATRADQEYHKQVAIKLVRVGLASRDLMRRFLSERQILANLDHPNIARLLDGNTTDDGVPYVVMEYVEGKPIDDYCDANRLGIVKRLEIFRKVCSAVYYAHQNLVVHRDIKPGNILVTPEGEPKLLDFGIAKLLTPDGNVEGTAETQTGVRLMTPQYASPEQARCEPITTASDIYSLGVVLYELLTGRHPYRIKTFKPQDVERAICEQNPEKPSTAVTRNNTAATGALDQGKITDGDPYELRGTTAERLRRRLRGDLDNIVMMALRKEPARRYGSAEQLSEDIRRYLEGLPVAARAATVAYRTRKFVGRHKVGVAVAALMVMVVTTLVGFYTWRLARERDRAQLEAAKAARVSEFLKGLFGVSDPSQSKGETITAKELLERGADKIKNELSDQPEVQSTMMNLMGTVYLSLGLNDRAEPLLQQALSTRREVYGDSSAEVAESLLALGRLLYARGDYEGSESLCRQALELNRRLFGNDSLEAARSMNLLATALHGKGDYAAAESLFRRVIDLRRKRQGEQNADVLTNLSSLSTVLIDKGDSEAAEPIMKEIVDLRRKLYGDRDPQLAIDINNLAAAQYSRGDLGGAEQLFREALALRREVLGDEHPEVAEGLNNLAVVLRDKGEYDEAMSLLRQAIAIETRNKGVDHWYVAYYETTLGLVLHAKGDYEAAEETFRQAIGKYKKAFPQDNGYSAVPVLGLGMVLTDKGSLEKAEPLLRRSLTVLRKALPAGHWQTAIAECALGNCLASMKRFDEAESLMLNSYATLKAKRGENSRATKDCADHLVKLYEGWHKPDRAAEFRTLLSK